MLRLLLSKDLRRARRNPLPWLINLLVPLCITALVGFAFGPRSSSSGGLGRIRLAIVDEDDSLLTQFLRGSANQGAGARHLEPVFLDRTAALTQVNANRIAAVLIIPKGFTRDYLTGDRPVEFELIKNPAQSIHPAVIEELMGALVTGLNAVARNLNSEFPDWRKVLEGDGDYRQVAALIQRTGDRLKGVSQYIDPPLVIYTKEVKSEAAPSGPVRGSGSSQMFSYLLLGMAGMFLLFLASLGMSDLSHEMRNRTLERYHTIRHDLLPFIGGKVLFSVVMLALCSLILLGGGGLLFRIQWQETFRLAVLTMAYGGFAAGLMALLVACVPDERRGAVLHNLAAMGLGLVGGCAFPPEQLPTLLREHVTPLLPSFWYVDAARRLQWDLAGSGWTEASLKLAVSSLVLIAAAAVLFRLRLRKGLRT